LFGFPNHKVERKTIQNLIKEKQYYLSHIDYFFFKQHNFFSNPF